MKISLILLAALFAVVPVLGLSAPLASAEEVVSYPEVINNGDTLYFNPNLSIIEVPTGEIRYKSSSSSYPVIWIAFYNRSEDDLIVGSLYTQFHQGSPSQYAFYFYTLNSSLVGKNLKSDILSIYPDYTISESDIGRPLLVRDSYSYERDSISFLSNTLVLDTLVFSLDSGDFYPQAEDSFVSVWGETADFVGDIFIQVGELFYDDTAEELTPIGTLAVILAGIAVVLLVWNLIRSFLPMRG